nr:MAG TPA: DNA cytosine methyltransferase [Caudoviricetes sp.]
MNRIYEEARQLPIFGGEKPFRIEKPIRLIELFAGYGSQALALKYLGVPFEHWKISEWAVKSISAYKDLHFCEDETDYSAGLTAEQIKEWLVGRISADYSTPMTEKQIAKLPEKQARKIYGNMQAICTSVLMAIFGQMLGLDYETKIKELTKELSKGRKNGRD